VDDLTFKALIAENLIYYRKRANLTQLEIADMINYSDKSVSKWERGDGVPDICVLRRIAEIYGVTLNDIINERTDEIETEIIEESQTEISPVAEPRKKHSLFHILLSVCALWLLSTIAFSFIKMLEAPVERAYMVFLYSIPTSFIVVEIFAIKWKLHPLIHLMCISTILWTTAMCLQLTLNVGQGYLLYVICAVAQLLGMFGFGLYVDMIPAPKRGWWKFWKRNYKK